MTSDRTFVIVGASLAGATAAHALRAEGFDGRVVLVGEEPHRPYERPPLSKGFLRGEAAREQLDVHGADVDAEQQVELRLGRRVTSLDPGAREVALDDGERLRYDALLLATGAEPRRLPVPGARLDGVLQLRTVDDAVALRERLVPGARLVVVGAGFIGAEVAASARQLGLEVTVVEPQAVPLEHVLGPQVGALYRDLHADHGVRMLLGTGVAAFEGATAVERVRTDDGRALDCDVVVAGVGVRPRAELAGAAGLQVEDGVVVDAQLRTSAPGVFAAGDVANAWWPALGERLRVEHWQTAIDHGRAAARAMLGRPAATDRIPYFFSDQYDTGMEYAGHARGWDRVVLRGDPASRELVAFWLAGDRVMAGMNMNVWGVTDAIQQLIRARTPVEAGLLADPDVPLERLAGVPA